MGLIICYTKLASYPQLPNLKLAQNDRRLPIQIFNFNPLALIFTTQ